MPKRVSSRPSDVNQAAFQMVQRSTAESEPKPVTANGSKRRKVTKAEISRIMSAMGKRGGKIGGRISSANLTPEQRRERALLAAKARWSKQSKRT